jgi:hypothetical protein
MTPRYAHVCSRSTPAIMALLAMLWCATPAEAQARSHPRAGFGLSLVPGNGTAVGVAGGLLFPVTDLGSRSIGIVGAASVHRLSEDEASMTVVGFAGGVRLTRTWGPTLKTFLQGALGFVQRREAEDGGTVRTDPGFTAGGGILLPVTDGMNFMLEADLGVILDSVGSNNVGVILTLGLSVPLGGR